MTETILIVKSADDLQITLERSSGVTAVYSRTEPVDLFDNYTFRIGVDATRADIMLDWLNDPRALRPAVAYVEKPVHA